MQNENLRGWFPGLTEEELATARENLDRYLELAWEIWEISQKNELPD